MQLNFSCALISTKFSYFWTALFKSNILWDLVDTSEIKITSGQLQKNVDCQPRYEGPRTSGRTAFAAQQDLEFGLSRVFQAQSRIKDASYAIGVFRSTQEAVDWLEED